MNKLYVALLILTFVVLIAGQAANKDESASDEGKLSRNAEHKKEKSGKFLQLFSIIRFDNDPCTGSNYNGTCMTSTECSRQNGTSEGSCAQSFGVCCVFRNGCGAVFNQNCSYFQNPGYSSSVTSLDTCEATVHKCGRNICQIRLDFENFKLAEPYSSATWKDADADPVFANDNRYGECETDVFKTDGSAYGLTTKLCGVNTGSHMYMDVPEQSNIACKLGFIIGPQDTSTERSWSIKISQIPCNANYKAPTGCTQYYTDTTGVIQNYNYQASTTAITSHHLRNQDQNICIRPASGYCTISYTGNPDVATAAQFVLSDSGDVASTDCTRLTDYLIIPGGTDGTWIDLICGAGFANTVTSSTKPFTATFIAGSKEESAEITQANKAQGFSLKYTQNTC